MEAASALVLLASLLLAARATQPPFSTAGIEDTEACRAASYAPQAASAILNSALLSTYQNVTTVAQAKQACLDLYNLASPYNNDFFSHAYFGYTASNSFYALKFCQTDPNYLTVGCALNTDYACIVYNPTLYPDGFGRIFTHAIGATAFTSFTTLTQKFTLSAQPWFNTPSATWSAPFTFFDTHEAQRGYFLTFPGGIIGADRFDAEPCSQCAQTNLVAWAGVNLPPILATSGPAFTGATSNLTLPTIITQMFSAMTQSGLSLTNYFQAPDIYLVYSNGDFYMIRTCTRINEFFGGSCSSYALFVQNRAIFGDSNIRLFAVSPSGTIGAVLSAHYPSFVNLPISSAWYAGGLGWGDTYYFNYFNGPSRVFAWPFVGGIAGAGWDGINTLCGPSTTASPFTTNPDDNKVCRDVSYAVESVNILFGLDVYDKYSNITNAANIPAACNAIYSNTNQYNNGFYSRVFMAYATTNSFYLVKYCATSTNYNTPGCTGNVNYVCVAYNPFVYPDGQGRVYQLPIGGSSFVLSSTTINLPFSVTAQPWFNTPTGHWSDLYVSIFAKTAERAFIIAFPGGRVGADRFAAEPCSQCLILAQASWPGTSVATILANTGAALASLSAASSLNNIVSYMFLAQNQSGISPTDYFTAPDSYLAFNNGSFYLLRPCTRVTEYFASCGTYALFAQNAAMFGDNNIYLFSVNATGVVNNMITNSYSINVNLPSTSEWFQGQIGWSDVFYFNYLNGASRVFAWPFSGGVAAAGFYGFNTLCAPTTSAQPATINSEDTAYCRAISYANQAVGFAVSNNVYVKYEAANTAAKIVSACQSLGSVLFKFNTGFAPRMFMAFTKSNSMYTVKNCLTATNYGTVGCTLGLQYVCLAWNPTVYPDGFGRVLAGSNGPFGPSFTLTSTIVQQTFNITNNIWYNWPSNSWTPAYTFLDGAQADRSFVAQVPGGYVGADRYLAEPCDACTPRVLNNYNGTLAAPTLAANGPVLGAISSITGLTTIVSNMLQALVQNQLSVTDLYNVPDLYLVYNNSAGEFYLLRTCSRVYGERKCTQYGFFAQNTVIFGDSGIRLFNVDLASGSLTLLASNYSVVRPVISPYNSNWFFGQIGWSDEYAFDPFEPPGRVYAWPFAGGVAGAGWNGYGYICNHTTTPAPYFPASSISAGAVAGSPGMPSRFV